MEKIKQNPLGTADVKGLIIKFSIPTIISFLINSIYNIVDQIFIGRGVGLNGIAATNIAFPLVIICTAIALLLGIGSASNISLNLGAGNKERAEKIAGTGIILMIIFGIALAVISLIFLDPLLKMFGATDDLMDNARIYTRIIAIGLPFQLLSTGLCQLIRVDGSPAYSMICMIAGAVINTILDPIFIFIFNMGIAGAALATIISQFVSTILAIIYIAKGFKHLSVKKEMYRINGEFTKIIFALGMSSFFNQIAMTVVQIVMNNSLKYYGELSIYGSEIPIASVGAMSKINMLFIGFTIGIAQGCQPINGYNYGAKNYSRVKETLKYALISATIISILAFLGFQLFTRQIISVFGEGTELYIEFSEAYLRIFMFLTFLNGIQPVTANYFTATGRAKIGMFISLTRQIIFLLPLLLILPIFFGIDGILYSGPIGDFITAVMTWFFVIKEFKKLDKLENEKNIGIITE